MEYFLIVIDFIMAKAINQNLVNTQDLDLSDSVCSVWVF